MDRDKVELPASADYDVKTPQSVTSTVNMDKQTEDRFAMSRDVLSRPGPSDYNVKQ